MACVCGHAIEEHGNDPTHPGSRACDYAEEGYEEGDAPCGCLGYEEEEDDWGD